MSQGEILQLRNSFLQVTTRNVREACFAIPSQPKNWWRKQFFWKLKTTLFFNLLTLQNWAMLLLLLVDEHVLMKDLFCFEVDVSFLALQIQFSPAASRRHAAGLQFVHFLHLLWFTSMNFQKMRRDESWSLIAPWSRYQLTYWLSLVHVWIYEFGDSNSKSQFISA